jgi:16S rRNA (adenine1518-N6/adenine1519-N6)-dimethyltransferase
VTSPGAPGAPGAPPRLGGADGLLTPADVRTLAAELAVRPTKKRGQNFLIDPNTVRRIVRLLGLRGGETVLEIGPGLGSLTLGLLPAAGSVVAVEIDDVLAAALPSTAARALPADAARRLRVLHIDGLALRPADLAAGPPDGAPGPEVLAANLPYNVAVPLLLTVLERFPTIRSGLVMVQAEVADRLTAAPGGRVYGAPSAKLAWYAEAHPAGPVPRAVFWPVPGVDSSLVEVRRRPVPMPDAARADVFAAVDAAFAQRRKTLRAALSGWAGSAAAAERIALAASVDPSARGETLDIAAFARLAQARAQLTAPTDGS